MFLRNITKTNLNVEYKEVRIENICSKIGKVVGGEVGEKIGSVIDEATKKVTVKIED